MGNFLDDLDAIVYYSYMDDKYLDFQTIMYLIDRDKTYTWRLLGKLKMPYIDYQNRRIYRFEDIMTSVEIVDMIDIDKLGI